MGLSLAMQCGLRAGFNRETAPCCARLTSKMVASEPDFQRRGYATAVMKQLAHAICDFDLGGLCPAKPEFYARLGWVFWEGPLFIRDGNGLVPTPDEQIMIKQLAKTPDLSLNLQLSAEWREGELW